MTTDHGARVARRYDWGDVPPSYAVVEAVAAAEGVDPFDLEQLYEQVNPDALDDLLANIERTTGLTVEFPFVDHQVTVTGDGRVRVD